MGFDNEETGAKKKYCRKTTKLFVMMIASVPKRERKLPALPKKKKKKKERKDKTPTPVFHELCTILHLPITLYILETHVNREHAIDFLTVCIVTGPNHPLPPSLPPVPSSQNTFGHSVLPLLSILV